jgi:glycosyltransferase involved in cell wall biosynthesis
MAVQLDGYAQLTTRQDPRSMADAFLRIAANPDDARAQALRGREMVSRDWSKEKAFGDLAQLIDDLSRGPGNALANVVTHGG